MRVGQAGLWLSATVSAGATDGLDRPGMVSFTLWLLNEDWTAVRGVGTQEPVGRAPEQHREGGTGWSTSQQRRVRDGRLGTAGVSPGALQAVSCGRREESPRGLPDFMGLIS